MTECVLGKICRYRTENASTDQLPYLSTESMQPNKMGVIPSEAAPSVGKARLFRKGDTLISNIRPYFKKIWQAEYDGCCSADVLVFEPHSCDSDYLYWLLSDDAFFAYMVASSKGTKMPRGDKDAIMRYKVRRQSATEQRRLAAALNPIRELIRISQRTNDYLAELLDALFVDMLNDADASWERLSLLDIASYKNGLAMQKFRPAPGDPGLPVLKIKELGQGACAPDSERCASTIDESVKIHDGNLVFSWSGTLLLDFWAGGDAGLNQHLFKVTSDRYPSWLYYLWTKHHMDRFIMLAKDRATTMGHIKRSALAESEVLIPPVEQLEVLTRRMQPIVDELIANKIQSHNLADLRDALLPRLMSGEIDVSKVDLTQPNNHLADC